MLILILIYVVWLSWEVKETEEICGKDSKIKEIKKVVFTASPVK